MLDVESYDSEVFSSGGSSEGSSSTAGSVIPSMELAASYPSEQAAKEAIELFGREHGFAVVVASSCNKKGKDGKLSRFVYLKCDRYGAPKEKEVRLRETGTRKCGCGFTIKLTKRMDSDEYFPEYVCSSHNHSLSVHPSCHPTLRRRDMLAYGDVIETGLASGRAPSSIQTDLRNCRTEDGSIDNNLVAQPTNRDISNMKDPFSYLLY